MTNSFDKITIAKISITLNWMEYNDTLIPSQEYKAVAEKLYNEGILSREKIPGNFRYRINSRLKTKSTKQGPNFKFAPNGNLVMTCEIKWVE